MFRKRFANNWQLLTSYNWIDAKGNTNSDSNADFQGDVHLPRSARAEPVRHAAGADPPPGQGRGVLHVPRSACSSAARSSWNSGTVASRTFLVVGPQPAGPRHARPKRSSSPATPTAGWRRTRSARSTNPAWGKVDLRAQYNRRIIGQTSNAEFFVDLFNIANNQSSIRNQDLVAGSGGNAFGSEILWVEPRRAFFGARVKF